VRRTRDELGLSNGLLLDEAEKAGFDALVTCDQNLVAQQNLAGAQSRRRRAFHQTWPSYAPNRRACDAVANVAPGTFSVASLGRQRRARRAPDLKCRNSCNAV
jgi:hypothetical protein